MLQRILLISMILCLAAVPASAGFKEGEAAYFNKEWNKALPELRPLAEAGDDRAMVMLGQMHMSGLGVERNYKEALSFFKRAALEKNNTEAMVHLGLLSDKKLAKEWFYRASQLGNGTAAYLYAVIISGLGKKPEDKDNSKPDLYNAYKWFRISASAKTEHSKYRGAADYYATSLVTSKVLPANDIAKADKEIAAWKPAAAATLGSLPALPEISEKKATEPKKP